MNNPNRVPIATRHELAREKRISFLTMNVRLSGYVTWPGGDSHGRLGAVAGPAAAAGRRRGRRWRSSSVRCDPARLRLLEFLLGAEHAVGECVAHIGLSQNRMSAHLACLAGCGYVQGRLRLRAIPPRRPVRLLQGGRPRVADLVTLARSLAADNAETLAGRVRIAPATA